MPAITRPEHFQEVLELARRLNRASDAIEDLDGARNRAHPNLVRSWMGPAKDEFDIAWDETTQAKSDAQQQMSDWEYELSRMFEVAAEDHNRVSYERALEEARHAVDIDRAAHDNAFAIEVSNDPNAISQPFNDSAHDRVIYESPYISRPMGPDYPPGQAFVHYNRYGDRWLPSKHTTPDPDVLAYM